MHGALRRNSFRMTFLNENFMNGLLNRGVDLLLGLFGNIWWFAGMNGAIDTRPNDE